MIIIASPSFWLAILGGALIVAAAVVWAVVGRIPTHLEAAGVFVSRQTTLCQTAETAGVVASVEAAVGDTVAAGDTLLVLRNEPAERSLQALQARREAVAAVSLGSTDDPATADTLELINLKLQYGATGQDLYRQQFEALSAALLDELDREIGEQEYLLEKTCVRAQAAGVVTDIPVQTGAAVTPGSELVTLRQTTGSRQVVCYVPVASGKTITPGMQVMICPTTVNRQQYGSMQGEVVAVDDYVASFSAMEQTLGSDALAQMFAQNGPVITVICQLRTDDTSANGFWWSNKNGADLILPEGTMITAEIITDEMAPISMLIPYL